MSLVSDLISSFRAARVSGQPIDRRKFPAAIGLKNLHADTLAVMELTVTGGMSRRQRLLLDRPDPDEASFYTTHKIVSSLWWHGTAVGQRNAEAVRILPMSEVGHEPDIDDSTRVHRWYRNGMTIPNRDIITAKINDDPDKGPLGRSPLDDAGPVLDMYGYALQYATDFFAGGGNPSNVLERDGAANLTYDPDEVAEDWLAARQERRPAVLPAGFKLSVPPANGELDALRNILGESSAEIARTMNAPPSLANAKVAGSLTYSTVAGEFRKWVASSLRPTWMARVELFYSELLDTKVDLDPGPLFEIVDATAGDAPAQPVAAEAPPAPGRPRELRAVV